MRRILAVATFALWVFLVYFLHESESGKLWILHIVNDWGSVAFIIFIALQCAFATLLLPCSAFTLIAGSLWGWEQGLLISVIATVLSSTTTYFLGRYFLSIIGPETVRRYSGLIVKYVNAGPFLSSLIIHINPFFPASALGYFFGVNKSKFTPYILGCLIGTIPLQVLFVYISSHLVLK